MITIEQAKMLKHGAIILQTKEFIQLESYSISNGFCLPVSYASDKTRELTKPLKWRVNGKIKLWKKDATRFKLPIKHGLFNYAYLTNDNCHLFNLMESDNGYHQQLN